VHYSEASRLVLLDIKALGYVRCHEPQGSGYYMHKQYRQSSLVPFPLGHSALASQDYSPEKLWKIREGE
jgi:hypothetical protein